MMRINIAFDVDEKKCDPKKLLDNFIQYLDEMLEVGFDEEDFPFTITGIELHSYLHEVSH